MPRREQRRISGLFTGAHSVWCRYWSECCLFFDLSDPSLQADRTVIQRLFWIKPFGRYHRQFSGQSLSKGSACLRNYQRADTAKWGGRLGRNGLSCEWKETLVSRMANKFAHLHSVLSQSWTSGDREVFFWWVHPLILRERLLVVVIEGQSEGASVMYGSFVAGID